MGQASLDDIVSNQGPAATPATSSVTAAPAAPAGGTASLDDIVANHGPATPTPPDKGILSKVGDFATGVGEGAVSSAGESIQSLPWVGKKIISPEAMQAEREYFKPGSAAEKYGQTTGDIAEPILEFVLGDEALKGVALAEKMGIASKIAKIAQDSPYIGKLLQHGVNAARMGTVGATEALAKGATPGQAAVAGVTAGVGGETLSTAIEAVSDAIQSIKALKNPFSKAADFIDSARAGATASQVPAEAAVRSVTGAGAADPIVAGSKTVVDAPLQDLSIKKTAAYKKVDDIVGFDLKAEKAQLKNDLYEVKQPGNIDKVEDIQQRINDSTARIAKANQDLVAAKIDPNEADALNTAWKAGQDFRRIVGRATAPDGIINVAQLAKNSQNARILSKYGDRLAQFFGKGDVAAGKPIADKFMSDLAEAQAAGVKGVNAQKLAKLIALRVAEGTVGFGAAAVGTHALGWWGN